MFTGISRIDSAGPRCAIEAGPISGRVKLRSRILGHSGAFFMELLQ
jgi:hypothetical protein